MGSRAFCDTWTGGMLIGYARVSTQETREESPEKHRRTPLNDVLGRRDAVFLGGGNPLTVSGDV